MCIRDRCIGRHAIVGAGSVVTKDVPDYAVAVGNPAKGIKIDVYKRQRWKMLMWLLLL